LRIGRFIARAPDPSDKHPRASPEVAHVRNGNIVVEPWNG